MLYMVRKAFVVTKNCPYCKVVKDTIRKKRLDIEIIDADTPKGFEFAERHKIMAVPQCVLIIQDGGRERVKFCTDKEAEELLR